MSEDFREPNEQETEAMFAKVLAAEVERQSFATFTAQNGLPVTDESLTLAKLEETIKRVEDVLSKEPIDTHIFVSSGGRQWIHAHFPIAKIKCDGPILGGISVNSLMGLEVWDDATVPQDEIQIGRIQWEEEWTAGECTRRKPFKVITKIVKIT